MKNSKKVPTKRHRGNPHGNAPRFKQPDNTKDNLLNREDNPGVSYSKRMKQ